MDHASVSIHASTLFQTPQFTCGENWMNLNCPTNQLTIIIDMIIMLNMCLVAIHLKIILFVLYVDKNESCFYCSVLPVSYDIVLYYQFHMILFCTTSFIWLHIIVLYYQFHMIALLQPHSSAKHLHLFLLYILSVSYLIPAYLKYSHHLDLIPYIIYIAAFLTWTHSVWCLMLPPPLLIYIT